VNIFVDPVSNVWFEPEMGFFPGKPVTCKANGFPRPSFQWIRTSDNVTVVEGPKLVVESTNNSYVCIATNVVSGRTYNTMSTEVKFHADAGISLQTALCNEF